MRASRWMLCALFLLGAAAPTKPAFNEPDGFQQLKFGADFKSLVPECPIDQSLSSRHKFYKWYETKDTCWAEDFRADTFKLWNVKIGDISLVGDAKVSNGRLAALSFEFGTGFWGQLFLIFKERYGAPTSLETVKWTSRGGVSVQSQVAKWIGKTISIGLDERGGTIDRGRLEYETVEWQLRRLDRFKESIKKGVKDL